MRTPRRLVAALAATALSWTTLTLVIAAPARADVQPPHDPATYYASAMGLSGTALATELNSIIDGHTKLTYAQVYDVLPTTDEDPSNTSNLIDFYSGASLAKSPRCGSGDCTNLWNREHTWPQSHGDIDTSGPGADLFHMRPLLGGINSTRGNLDFDESDNPYGGQCPACSIDGNSFEPRPAVKGDLARGLFYMDVRYNGDASDEFAGDLTLLDSSNTSGPTLGKLSTLVAWSLADPPDDAERARNNLIDGTYQHNRNPFIDHPEWVCSIWGNSNPAACAATNQPPQTSPMVGSTPEDSPSVSVPLSATDPNSDPLTWALVAPAAAHGTASITGSAPNFSLTYTPHPHFHGQDVVGVRVNDGQGGLTSTTVTITVTPVNDPPTVDDIGSDEEPILVPKFNSRQITLSGQDVDADPLTYSVVSSPGRGNVTINGNVATYTATSSSGIDGFTYRATDPSTAQSLAGTVTVQIVSSPTTPVATPVTTTTAEDTAKTVTLTASDPDGDPVIYALANPQPAKGTVSRNGDQVTYTPNPNATGSDTFGWSASDGTSTVTSTVSVTITAVNDAPVANAASTSTPEDTAKSITLSGSDPDGPTPTYAIAGQPGHGSVNLVGTTATYTPAADYHGPDSFTFTASDGTLTSAPSTVDINVTAVNDPPSGTPASATTAEETAKVITLVGTDVDGNPLTYAIGTTPGHGVVQLNGVEATYTPATNYNGPDSFTFTVNDGTVTSPVATVSLTVTPVNDAPVSNLVSKNVAEDSSGTAIALDATDVDGDPLTYALGAEAPQHGGVVFSGATATYTPDPGYVGSDSFTYTASDGSESDEAPVAVTVTNVNDPPTVDDESLSTTAGTMVSKTLTVADPDGDPVAIVSVTAPTNGSVDFVGNTVQYTPAIRSGADTFSVTVSDGQGGTDSAQVSVTIAARTATLAVTPTPATRGKPVTTTITATGPVGPKPGGLVTLTGNGATLGTATLDAAGIGTVTWTPTRTGTVGLVATYMGDSLFDPATSPSRTVVVAPTKPTFAFGGKVRAGTKGRVKVTMSTVAGVPPSGSLTLKVGSKTFTAVLRAGVATFKIGKVPNKRKLKVTATFGGDAQYAGGSATFKYKT